MWNKICPYCNFEGINVDDIREPDEFYEVQCSNCGKLVGVDVEYSPHYTIIKVPCWNGETECNMVKVSRSPKVIGGQEQWICTYCGKRENRPAPCSHDCILDKSLCWKCEIPS